MTQGERIKELRKRFVKDDGTTGLQQKEFAIMLGVTPSALSRFEQSDNLRPETIKKIADLLGCSYNYLKFGSEHPEVETFRKEIKEYSEILENMEQYLEINSTGTEKDETTARIKEHVSKDIGELREFIKHEKSKLSFPGFYFFFIDQTWENTTGTEKERLNQFKEYLEEIKERAIGNPFSITYEDLKEMDKDIAEKLLNIINSVMVGDIF